MQGMWTRRVILLLRLFALFLTLGLFFNCPRRNSVKAVVVTTLPDLADWVREVGGERIEVMSLLQGYEEPHSYDPKPSDVEKLARAKVLVRVGLGLEEWLEGVIKNTQNPKLRVITLSDFVEVLFDAEGRGTHTTGNPHIWLDPTIVPKVLPVIVEALSQIDPSGTSKYHLQAERYLKQLDSAHQTLLNQVKQIPNPKFVAMHNSWPYFCRAFGFEMVGAIEPLPGQEPSVRHLTQLVKRMKKDSVRVIVIEPHHRRDIAEALAQEVGAKVVVLSPITHALPQIDTYLKLLDYNVRTLLKELLPNVR